MFYHNIKSPVIVIVGPTAVGKTDVSICLAERLGTRTEIVSADSRLFYRGMDIGTAKPTIAERHNIPHHLIDVADPSETWSLALFQQRVREVIDSIHARKGLPIIVGGTGQYVHSITQGWAPPSQQPDLNIREVLQAWAEQIGPLPLYEKLAILDPAAAQLIDYRNVRRTIRALEVILLTGERFSAQRRKLPPPYSLVIIGLRRPRSELYARIDARIDKMIADGLVTEVKNLLSQGYPPDLPTFSAIGYREIIQYLQDKITLDEAVILIKRATREFVRRQANWFKESDPSIHWFDMADDVVNRIDVTIHSIEEWQCLSH